jgi:hypothetical protein
MMRHVPEWLRGFAESLEQQADSYLPWYKFT